LPELREAIADLALRGQATPGISALISVTAQ
jgi:hypothetical protein